jgi:hypothetical protein
VEHLQQRVEFVARLLLADGPRDGSNKNEIGGRGCGRGRFFHAANTKLIQPILFDHVFFFFEHLLAGPVPRTIVLIYLSYFPMSFLCISGVLGFRDI